ncbi:hypothetical protein SDC9_99722 [bioreactor metagenome]|uniref:Uncharacterized protein n=1 Tax=bioreactor metagenome TaxID=1076179 RepID=A0A645AJP0_9ZZZZ
MVHADEVDRRIPAEIDIPSGHLACHRFGIQRRTVHVDGDVFFQKHPLAAVSGIVVRLDIDIVNAVGDIHQRQPRIAGFGRDDISAGTGLGNRGNVGGIVIFRIIRRDDRLIRGESAFAIEANFVISDTEGIRTRIPGQIQVAFQR